MSYTHEDRISFTFFITLDDHIIMKPVNGENHGRKRKFHFCDIMEDLKKSNNIYSTVAFERGHVAAVFICLLSVGAFLSEAIVCEYFIFSHLQSITPSHQKISLSKQSRGNTLENGRSKKTRKVKTASNSYRLWLWLYQPPTMFILLLLGSSSSHLFT